MQTQAYNLNPEFADLDQLVSDLETKWSDEQYVADMIGALDSEIANSRYYDLCIENLDGASGFF